MVDARPVDEPTLRAWLPSPDELVFIASLLFVRLAHAFSAARAQESLAEVAAAQRASREELAAAATAAAAGLPPGLVAEVPTAQK